MPLSSLDVAVLGCLEICAEEGWLPNVEQTLRLVHLRAEYRAGCRSEHAVLTNVEADEERRYLRRLEWLRWLAQRGILNEN